LDALREAALAAREQGRASLADAKDRKQRLLVQAATRAPLLAHAARVAAAAASAAAAAAAAAAASPRAGDGSGAAATEESEFAPPPASNSSASPATPASASSSPSPSSEQPTPPPLQDVGEGLPGLARGLAALQGLLAASSEGAHQSLAAALLAEGSGGSGGSGGEVEGGGVPVPAARSDPLNLLFYDLATDADDDPCAGLLSPPRPLPAAASSAAAGGPSPLAASPQGDSSDRAGGAYGGGGVGLLGFLGGGGGGDDERASEWSFSEAAAPQNREAAEESEARARFGGLRMPSFGKIFESGPSLGSSQGAAAAVAATTAAAAVGSRAGVFARHEQPSQDRPPLDGSFGRSAAADPRASLEPAPTPGQLPASVPVQVPPGTVPGQPMVVTVEGRRFRFSVPRGLAPGAVFQLDLATATEVVRRKPPPLAATALLPPPTPSPPPNEDVGADAVAGWLMERGVGPGDAIDACGALVGAGLDRASRLGSAEPASLRLAGLSDAAVVAVLGDGARVRAALASVAHARGGEGGSGGSARSLASAAPPSYGGYSTADPGAYPELGGDDQDANDDAHLAQYGSPFGGY
jgi:hypothetical protein